MTSAFAAVSILFAFPAFAQVLQPQRLEVPLAVAETHFGIIPAAEQGLFLERSFTVNKDQQLHLIRLDTAFTELWQGFVPVERNYVVSGKKAFGDQLFILLKYKDYTKNDLILITLDIESGRYYQHVIKGFIPFAISEFVVTDKAVIVGGYYNRVPLALHYSRTSYTSKVLPAIFNEAGELNQIRAYPDASFDVLISARNFKKQRTITIKSYDPDGNLIKNVPLETETNKHLIFGRSIKTADNSQIVAGVYGNRSAEYSRGIFIASIDAAGLQTIRYYNFADLENFFKYMKVKREKRIKNRIERRKIKGKRIKFNYRFLVHELVPYQDQYVLLGEAFYPKYINLERGYFTGFFYRNVPAGSVIQNGRIFDGYYYTHAVVMGFQPDGDLVWDNSFEINDVRTFTLEQFVKLDTEDDKIALLYLFDNKLRTKIIHNNQVLEGKTIDPIKTNYPGIAATSNRDINKLDYWYGDYLLAYGTQEFESGPNGAKRRVFYVNKVKHAQPGD